MKRKTLLVDNYDSFTWNLVQLVGELGGEPVVVRNDEATLADVKNMHPTHIVMSPGPGRPDDPRRVGVCRPILEELAGVPVLGVCLGHQAIVCAFGGRVVGGEPVHGKTAAIEHEGDGLLADLPRPFAAMRYHSLVADRASLPSCLKVTAWCKDGTIMGVRHRERDVHGVQFHPESIGTPIGKSLVARFLALAAVAALLVACGGGEAKAPAQSPAPAATPEREPDSIAEAEEQIERAKSELAAKEDKDTTSTEARPSEAPSGGVREERATTGASSCASSCRALSSMRRAVTALCRMTGEEDARCSGAKKTLADSESRVARCHCGS